MALQLMSAWGHTLRPWGYEVRADYVDDDGTIYNEVLTWPTEPDAKALDVAVTDRLALVESRIVAAAEVVPEKTREDLAVEVSTLESRVTELETENDDLKRQIADADATPIVRG